MILAVVVAPTPTRRREFSRAFFKCVLSFQTGLKGVNGRSATCGVVGSVIQVKGVTQA